jgi:TatD DNase family protein
MSGTVAYLRMIDSHCHLTDRRLGDQLPAVLARARDAGVTESVTIGTTPEDAIAARDLAHAHDGVFFAAGIHPNNSLPFKPDDVAQLRELLTDSRCRAAGEMGLDYYWKDVPPDHQKSIFAAQLELARSLSMPVIIHCRQAVTDTLAVLRDFPGVGGVFHCFTGTPAEARDILDAGFHLGFTGPLTFKANQFLRDIVRDAPSDRILIETDAPYLTPEPYRSVKTNEPMYVRHVLEAVAIARGLSLAEADALTTANTRRLYRKELS